MRYIVQLLLLSGILFSQIAFSQDLATYRLGSGDTIRISIYGEPDMDIETILTDTGTINYPFIGSVKVTGLTIIELQKIIISGLTPDYLLEPEINIHIKAYRQFYIYGEVKQPGGYEFQPGLTLRKAIAIAGGLTPRASKSKMYLISEHDDIDDEALLEIDDHIQPGDIINIKQSFF